MNSTKLTPQQLGDLKREFASVMIGDMTPKELFEFAVHRVLCDVATMDIIDVISRMLNDVVCSHNI